MIRVAASLTKEQTPRLYINVATMIQFEVGRVFLVPTSKAVIYC